MTTNTQVQKAAERGTRDGIAVAEWIASDITDVPGAQRMLAELDADRWGWDEDLHTPGPTFSTDAEQEAYYCAAQDAWDAELRRHALAIVSAA